MGSFAHHDIDVFVGVDMAEQDHYAHVIDLDGTDRFDRSVVNDEAAIGRLIDDASRHGRVALVIDMPSSAAQLLLAVARQCEVPVAYVTGLQMRRAAELYAGAAKTDPRDAKVLAEFARRHADQLAWLDVTDELLAKLRILNGRDVDLAEDANRASNRCRDALVSISPGLERAIGARLGHAGVRDLLELVRSTNPSACQSSSASRTEHASQYDARMPSRTARRTNPLCVKGCSTCSRARLFDRVLPAVVASGVGPGVASLKNRS